MKINGKAWKPMKMPNDSADEVIDVHTRFEDIMAWLFSQKYEGGRVELLDGKAMSVAMNLIASKQVQEMAYKFCEYTNHTGIIEAEFFAPNMNFSEIMHFFKTEDITSEKTRKKYVALWKKTNGGTTTYKKTVRGVVTEVGWPYPGRTPEWCCTWHPELEFYMFDHVTPNEDRNKEQRYEDMLKMHFGGVLNGPAAKLIKQFGLEQTPEIEAIYTHVVANGGEGLVAYKKNSLYKPGRLTLASNEGFKIKDNNVEFKCTIVGVEEGTVSREGSTKLVDHFGHSKTSQVAADRLPSGIAKGFRVRWDDNDDGREFSVSIKGFDHPDRIQMLNHPDPWIGKSIIIVGMKPTKIGGLPRSSHYIREEDV